MAPVVDAAKYASALRAGPPTLISFVVRRQSWIALVIAAVYFLLYSALSVLRHQTYHSFGFDLALFDQVFWNTTQGRPFESTMSQAMPVPHSLLGDHFSPVFWLIVPFYFAYPHPETLLVVQTFALALGAWPVYLLAKLKLPGGYPVLWVLVYFLFVPLAHINLYDFHETSLSVAPLGFALYFIERGNRVWFLVFLLLTFLVKEEMALVGAGFGAYVLLGKRDWKLGLGVLAGSLATFALVIQLVVPYFSGGRGYPYIGDRYAAVGGSPLGVLRTMVTNPLRIATEVIQPKKISYIIGMFGPVLGLSAIAGWAALLVLPTLSYIVLSSYEPQFSFTKQYSAPLIPLIIGTAIIGMARLPASIRRWMAGAVVASSLVFSWAFGDLPYSRKFDPGLFQTEARYAAFAPQLAQIGSTDRVSAAKRLAPHLSERRYIYEAGFEGIQDAQWVALDYEANDYDMAAFEAEVAHVQSLGYEEVATGYGLALLRKP